jgi:hypothetical protein
MGNCRERISAPAGDFFVDSHRPALSSFTGIDNQKSTNTMNFTATPTRDRPDAVPNSRTAFLSEAEHQEFARSGATYADWRSGAHAERQRTLQAEREMQSKEAEALRPYTECPLSLSDIVRKSKALDSEMDRLESAESKFLKQLDVPQNTAAELLAATQSGVLRLLATVGIVNPDTLATSEAAKKADADAAQIEKRLESEKRASVQITEALKIVRDKLAFARKAHATLRGRADEAVKIYLRDYAKIYGQQYAAKLPSCRK